MRDRAAFVIRTIDIILSAGALVFSSIPMMLIGLAIRLYDGGPPLFRQMRVGAKGEHFTILKFRTMSIDLNSSGAGDLDKDESAIQARARFRVTVRGDPRITKLGKFLRPSHLDELPQFWNVLVGNMSFVGVRPDTPAQKADYSDAYWQKRHLFRPGITGPAQLSGSDMNIKERTEAEQLWLDRPTIWHYFTLLWKTILKVWRRDSN